MQAFANAIKQLISHGLSRSAPRLHAPTRRVWRWLRYGELPFQNCALTPEGLDAFRARCRRALPSPPADNGVAFEVILDGAGRNSASLESALAPLCHPAVTRVHVVSVTDDLVIDASSAYKLVRCSSFQNAIAQVVTSHVLLVEADVTPEREAVGWFAQALKQCAKASLIYADEMVSNPACPVRLRPVWDPVRLEAEDYVGGCMLVSRDACLALARAGHDRLPGTAVALRNLLNSSEVWHLPLLLSSRVKVLNEAPARVAPASLVAQNPPRAPETNAADRVGPVVSPPSLSVIVPTRDGMPHLRDCIEGVLAEFRAHAIAGELIIMDNQSSAPATSAYLQSLVGEWPECVQVVHHDAPFNYSAINNRAAELARGELLLLLNDDVAPITPDWLPAMMRWLDDPRVGAVGGRLLYPDGTIQHAGVVMGLGGVAGHAGAGIQPDSEPARMLGMHVPRSVSGVTAACLMTRKSLYSQLGGLDESELTVAFNDVDFCLRLRAEGIRIVCAAEVTLRHFESVSRGREDTFAKRRRFSNEVSCMQRRWGDGLRHDPFHNPSLDLSSTVLAFRSDALRGLAVLRSEAGTAALDDRTWTAPNL